MKWSNEFPLKVNEYALARSYYASNMLVPACTLILLKRDFPKILVQQQNLCQPPSIILDNHTWPSQFGWPFVFWAFAAAGAGRAAPVRWFDVTCSVKPKKRMVHNYTESINPLNPSGLLVGKSSDYCLGWVPKSMDPRTWKGDPVETSRIKFVYWDVLCIGQDFCGLDGGHLSPQHWATRSLKARKQKETMVGEGWNLIQSNKTIRQKCREGSGKGITDMNRVSESNKTK